MMKACVEIPKQLPAGLCQRSLFVRAATIHRRFLKIKYVPAALVVFAMPSVVSWISEDGDPGKIVMALGLVPAQAPGRAAQVHLQCIQHLAQFDGAIVHSRSVISGDSILAVNDMVAS